MKRKKISKRACGSKSRNEEAEAGQVEIQHSGCSITNLPGHVLAAILFRLPITEIIACKCICKTWNATISNPEFANMHYAQSQVVPIAQPLDYKQVSRILFPLELEQEGAKRFIHKLKIPVRNFPMVVRNTINGNEEITLKAKDHGYKVVNSCNGFLCLSERFRNKPVAVCNPFTGEFINLPQATNVLGYDYIGCGFGFSPKTNQYKVVRIFELRSPPDRDIIIPRLAQVHILGASSWKNIQSAPCLGYKLAFPTYLNGAVHWFCHLEEKLSHMVSFDCEKEDFLPFPLPPVMDANRENVGMGVLGGCLCICDSSNLTSISVWVMKNYGVEKSWTQLFKIDMSCSVRLLYGLYQPIKYMNNGALLMFNYPRCFLVHYDPRKPELKLFEDHPKSSLEVFAHTPSFISLKDVLAGCKVEVLNVYSRCAGLKLKGEASAISLHRKMNLDFDPDYEYLLHDVSKESDGSLEYWWGMYEYKFSNIWLKP